MKLDKYDNLMIRACKANGNTVRRLRKIWRHRCLLPEKYNYDDGILYHLLSLLEARKKKIDFRGWITILDDIQRYSSYEPEKRLTEHVLSSVIGKIAITDVDQWEGYISPAKFRKIKEKV